MLEKARSKCSALPVPVAAEAEVAEPAKIALQKSIPSGPTLKKQPIALAKENTPPKKDKL